MRNLNVESVTVEDFQDEEYHQYPATHYTLSFSLFKVNTWGDRVYFTTFTRETNQTTNWYLSFSEKPPPGNTGGGGMLDYPDFLSFVVYMAEFPYMNQTIYDNNDGLQTYFFYRVHLWLNGTVHANDTIEIGADYMKQPEVVFHSPGTVETTGTGSKDAFLLTNEKRVDGKTLFDLYRNPSENPTITPQPDTSNEGFVFSIELAVATVLIIASVLSIVLLHSRRKRKI